MAGDMSGRTLKITSEQQLEVLGHLQGAHDYLTNIRETAVPDDPRDYAEFDAKLDATLKMLGLFITITESSLMSKPS